MSEINTKKFKSICNCKLCNKAMVYFKENGRVDKLICNTYHQNKGCVRNVWKEEEIEEIINQHEIDMENVVNIKLGINGHYEIIQNNSKVISWNGCTLIL